MDLNERFNVLVQGVEIAQRAGKLSLDNAVEAKNVIEKIQKGEELKESFTVLTSLCEFAQAAGSYNLHDAHLLYLATEDINDEIDKFIAENTQPQQADGADADKPQQEIPISVEETKPEEEDKWEGEMPSEQPAKKTSKKKK
jgi:hypothetical protein